MKEVEYADIFEGNTMFIVSLIIIFIICCMIVYQVSKDNDRDNRHAWIEKIIQNKINDYFNEKVCEKVEVNAIGPFIFDDCHIDVHGESRYVIAHMSNNYVPEEISVMLEGVTTVDALKCAREIIKRISVGY